jgi:hypothetical protein
MNININDEKYNDKPLNPIFNGGVAGVAKNISARVEKKKDGDSDNAPKYKIIFTDENNGEFNKGYFDNVDGASQKAQDYFVREMKHLLRESNTKTEKEKYTSYSEILDDTMKILYKEMPKNKYNVAVSFGSKDFPKRFLELDGFWGLRNIDSDLMPNLTKDALRVRPMPDNEETVNNDLVDTDGDITEEEVDW